MDCASGRDGDSGTSPNLAWKSLGRANKANLRPGDRLLLKRGCTFSGPLVADWNGTAEAPILIGAYGDGPRPVIQNARQANLEIRGSHQILEELATWHAPASYDRVDAGCQQQAYGWRLGAQFVGAHHNLLRNSRLSGAAIGVFLNQASHHNRVMHNQIVDNTGLWDNLDATGVLLRGDANEIGQNHFEGNRSRCKPGKSIAIELYNATGSNIHHNTVYGDRVFAELGRSGSAARDNTLAYNLHTTNYSPSGGNGARFVVTHGTNTQFGPVWNTTLLNNTVYYTGADSQGVVCQGRCTGEVLTLRNTILVVREKALYVGAGNSLTESHNLYWHPDGQPPRNNFVQNWTLASSSLIAPPRFIDPAGRDFHLRDGSAAINQAGNAALNHGYARDLDGDSVPAGGAPDIGVDEVTGAAATATAPEAEPVAPAPLTIQAEDYRAGGEGVGYHDTTPGNQGAAYRGDDVDLQPTSDAGGGFNLGWVDHGEWLDYDLSITQAGQYVVSLRVASMRGGAGLRLLVDGVEVSGLISIPATGDWQAWTEVTTGPITLPAGNLTLTLVSEMAGVNINHLTISP